MLLRSVLAEGGEGDVMLTPLEGGGPYETQTSASGPTSSFVVVAGSLATGTPSTMADAVRQCPFPAHLPDGDLGAAMGPTDAKRLRLRVHLLGDARGLASKWEHRADGVWWNPVAQWALGGLRLRWSPATHQAFPPPARAACRAVVAGLPPALASLVLAWAHLPFES